jgi:alpha-D-ribose 1-methylphosphonate 5-triphosphate synthase subunit PhnH
MAGPALKLGFERPVQDSQAVFRQVMMAMARPGSIHAVPVALDPPAGLSRAAAGVALALCDFETPVWLDPALARDDAVTGFLRFHTGAPLVGDPAAAHFAFLPAGAPWPSLEAFALGTLAYPDRSTTLVAEVGSLSGEGGWTLTGPGIAGTARLAAAGVPADMLARLADNRSLFPRGVDLVLTCGDRLAALPRSTIVEG